MITVVLNAYKRQEILNKQISSIKNQSIKVKDIFIWNNNASQIYDCKFFEKIKCINSTFNFGVWSRFSLCLNAKTDYVCVFDDDTIPGINWLKNCLETIEEYNGLLGTRGVRFSSKKKYFVGEEFGWNNPNENVELVDIVGHSWFFRREWLSTFWRELPDIEQSSYVGEDIHFSYTLQKYLGLKTYVPKHPKTHKDMWGSDPELAISFGTDKNSISYNSKRQKEMDETLIKYLNKGFQINPSFKIVTKGTLKEAKSKLGKILKKI